MGATYGAEQEAVVSMVTVDANPLVVSSMYRDLANNKLIMWEHNLTELKRGEIRVHVPSVINDWEDNVKKWTRITYGSIFSCFVESVACDGNMSHLKSSEAYQYLHSNKVGQVLLKEVGNDLVYLKADTEPSQSLHDPDDGGTFRHLDIGVLLVEHEGAVLSSSLHLSPASVKIIIEGEVVMDNIQDLLKAMYILFGLAYALRLNYPKSMNLTFQFIQQNLGHLVTLQGRNKRLQGACEGSYRASSTTSESVGSRSAEPEGAYARCQHHVCEEFPQHQGALRRPLLALEERTQAQEHGGP